MRKTISIVLSLLMVLSLGLVAVQADDTPTPIATAEDFAGMAADGNYKLTADITLTATYTTTFTGKLDGDGHTVTISAPIFKTLTGATVSNLKIEGTAAAGNSHSGALSVQGSKLTITNVTNNAKITSTKSGAYMGGIIGSVQTGGGKYCYFDTATNAVVNQHETSTFTNCVNNGEINSEGASGTPRMGGIVGNAAKYQYCIYVKCVNNGKITTDFNVGAYTGGIAGSTFGGEAHECVNNGEIDAPKSTGWVGGIVARLTPSQQGTDQSFKFDKCVNNGKLSIATDEAVTSGYIGGISAGTGTAEFGAQNGDQKTPTWAVYAFDGCVNNGEIIGGGNYAGGILGYVYGQNKIEDRAWYQYATVTNCTNKGKITGLKNIDPIALFNADATKNPGANAATYTSQFIGYTNANCTVIKDNIGAGEIVNVNDDYKVIFGLSSADAAEYQVSGNKVIEGTKNFSYACDAYAKDGSNYTLNLTTSTDAETGVTTVTGDRSYNRIALTADLADKVQVLTAAQMDALLNPTQGGSTPTTGDAAIWFAVVGAVALLGMAVAVKTVKSK